MKKLSLFGRGRPNRSGRAVMPATNPGPPGCWNILRPGAGRKADRADGRRGTESGRFTPDGARLRAPGISRPSGRKLACALAVVLVLLSIGVSAQEYDMSGSLEDLYDNAPDAVTEHVSPGDLNPQEISKLLEPQNIIDFLTGNLSSALTGNIGMLFSLAGLLIIMAVYDALRDSFNQRGSKQLADFFCAAAVALAVCPPFLERINELSGAISDLSGYMEISLPVLTAIVAASGNVSSAGVLHFFIYNAAAFTGNLFATLLMPLAGTYMCIGIASAITDNDGLKSLSSGIRAVVNKGIVILSTVFTAMLSLQGVIAGAGDTLSRRAMKLAVGSFLPITGNLMSESVDTFMSGVGIIRSVAGVFGIIVIFYMIIIPVLKTLGNFLLIKLSGFLCDMLGTTRVRGLLTVIGDGYGMLLSMAAGVGVMFITCMAFLLLAGGAA